MTPDARYQVDTDGSPIALIRALLDEGPRHVLKPIIQPRFNGPLFRQIAELPSIASLLQRPYSLDNLRLGGRGNMTAIRASLIRETNCDASVPTPIAAFVDRRPPVALTAPRDPAPAPMPLRSSSRKVTKASAGTRRKRPIRTDSTAPELTSAYMTVLPTPSRWAASSTVKTSGSLS